MKELRVNLYCCFCSNQLEIRISLPEEWHLRYAELSSEEALCPDHVIIGEFFDDQCPGCVSCWGECGLWRDAFFEKPERPLSDDDYFSIEKGLCPRRLNGTFGLEVTAAGSKIQQVCIADQATSKSGKALAIAIKTRRKADWLNPLG